eukprot:746716-Hanusia_phi.AAC.4
MAARHVSGRRGGRRSGFASSPSVVAQLRDKVSSRRATSRSSSDSKWQTRVRVPVDALVPRRSDDGAGRDPCCDISSFSLQRAGRDWRPWQS